MMIEFTLKNNGELDHTGMPVFRKVWVSKNNIELMVDHMWEVEMTNHISYVIQASSAGGTEDNRRRELRRGSPDSYPAYLKSGSDNIITSYPCYFVNGKYEVTEEEFDRIKELLCNLK